MYNNNIIELFEGSTKILLYSALKENKNIMFTRNERTVPIRTKTHIENVYTTEAHNRTYIICVEPDKQQLEYFEFKILDIVTAIENDIEIQELKDFLQNNGKDKFMKAISHTPFEFLGQYNIETVYNYISSL